MNEEWVPLTFEKGLNLFDPRESLESGQAQALQNWEIVGEGIHPRPAWKAAGGSPTGAPATARGRGIFTNWYESGVRKLVLAFKDAGNAFSFYKTSVADPTTFSSYTSLETALAVAAAQVNDPVDFAMGNSKLVYTNPGFPTGRLRSYTGSAVSAIATDNIAGRFILYYLSRFWTGGALTNPTYLRYSELGDETNWDVANNFIPVSQDDGEPIEDAVVWDRGIVLGKAHSIHFLSGSIERDFQLSVISDRIGVARGTSSLVVAEPYGVFVLGLDGQVYLYDGSAVTKVSRRLAVSTVSTYMTGAFVGGKLFVVAAGNGGTAHVYEPDSDRWRTENWQDTNNLIQDLAVFDDRYLLATPVGGTARALSVRNEQGLRATGTYRDPGRDPGAAEAFIATTKEFWPLGALGKIILKSVWVQYRQWTGGTSEKVTITPVVDGVDLSSQAKTIGGKAAAGVYAERVDFGAPSGGGRSIALKFTSSPTSSEPETYSFPTPPMALILTDRGPR